MSLVDPQDPARTPARRAAQRTRDGNDSRAQAAEAKVTEYEVQIEQLEERIQDLESGLAVEQTASRSTVDESRVRRSRSSRSNLPKAKASSKTALRTAASLRKRVDATETELAARNRSARAVEAELAEAKRTLGRDRQAQGDLQRACSPQRPSSARCARPKRSSSRSTRGPRLQNSRSDVRARSSASSTRRCRSCPGWSASRIRATKSGKVAALEAAENRARNAEQQMREANDHAREYADRMREGAQRVTELRDPTGASRAADGRAAQHALSEAQRSPRTVRRARSRPTSRSPRFATSRAKLRASEQRQAEVDARARDIEQRAKDAAERIVDAERRARDGQEQLAEMTQMLAAAETQINEARSSGGSSAGSRAPARNRATTDHRAQARGRRRRERPPVRREYRARDRAARARPPRPEGEGHPDHARARPARVAVARPPRRQRDHTSACAATAARRGAPSQHARYTQLVARARRTRSEDGEAREGRRHAQASARRGRTALGSRRSRARTRTRPTCTGNALPIEFAEHLNTLEESIDSLRANMRAASDETASMDQTESGRGGGVGRRARRPARRARA